MKLASFKHENRISFGAVVDGGIVDLARRLPQFATLRALLGDAGGLDAAKAALGSATADVSLSDLEFLPVIPDSAKIFCIGVNYADHLAETKIEKAPRPTVFLRYAASQVGHRQPMLLPRESSQFDFEGEVALVIGRAGRRIAVDDAWKHVAGFACYNDGSIRDWQFHTSQWGPGKNFAATGAFGPWMTSFDEFDMPATPLRLTTRLNGETVQRTDTSLLVFTMPELIAYCSTILPLEPGDVIVTGTPGGVGMARQPPLYMKAGDVVEVEVSGVGVLSNPIQAD